MKKDYKKVTLFFLSNPVPFNIKNYKKQKGVELVTRRSSKQALKYSLISDSLINWTNLMKCGFWLIPKITSANSCKRIYDIINYSTFICPFEFGKSGNEGKKIRKYHENKKSFFNEIKRTFHSFSRALIWRINKNSRHKFWILAFL